MADILLLFLGFIFGELLLIFIIVWTYGQLRSMGVIRNNRRSRAFITGLFIVLPLALAAFTLPGILERLEQQNSDLPSTGGSFPQGTPGTPAISVPLATPQGNFGTLPPGTPGATPPAGEPGSAPGAPAGQPVTPGSASPQPSPGTTEPAAAEQAPGGEASPTLPPTTGEAPQAGAPATPDPGAVPAPMDVPITGGSSAANSSRPRGRIAFACQIFKTPQRDQICLVNADGSDFRRMTQNDQADHNDPALSPDGQTLYYASNETGFFEIYAMDMSGATVQLTNGGGDSLSPAVSRDNTQVAFTRRVAGRNAIWVMERDGGNPRQVFGPPEGEGWNPVWSPTGEEILFSSNLPDNVQLFMINTAGTNLRQVTNIVDLRGNGARSPDGRLISGYIGAPWLREIFIINADGSDPHLITSGGNNLAPSFSPDSQWIAFVSYRDQYQDENGCEIYIMRVDGSRVSRLTHNDYCDWQPSWGP